MNDHIIRKKNDLWQENHRFKLHHHHKKFRNLVRLQSLGI